MDAVSWRSIVLVAILQATVALVALASSPAAAIAAAAVGALAVGRYFAVAGFASTLGSRAKEGVRFLATSAWALGMIALGAAVAAVAVKVRPALPWAVAAALVGPFGMSLMALVSGIAAVTSRRPAIGGPAFGKAGHSGGKQ